MIYYDNNKVQIAVRQTMREVCVHMYNIIGRCISIDILLIKSEKTCVCLYKCVCVCVMILT